MFSFDLTKSFSLSSVKITNYGQDLLVGVPGFVHPGDSILPLNKISGSSTSQKWATPNKEVIINVSISTSAISITARNANANGFISEISMVLPEIKTQAQNRKIYIPKWGGYKLDWITPVNADAKYKGQWPGDYYSPFIAVYDPSTSEGAGIVWFNDALSIMAVEWVASDNFYPFMYWRPHIRRGNSSTMRVAYYSGTEYPNKLIRIYREHYFKPSMANLKMPQTKLNLSGFWYGGGVPKEDGVVNKIVNNCLNDYKASGVLLYSTALAGGNYNPNPVEEFWWSQLSTVSVSLFNFNLAGLVNPWESMTIRAPDNWVKDGTMPLNVSNLNARLYFQRQALEMITNGMRYAYWDAPHNNTWERSQFDGHEYAQVLSIYKRWNITLIPENSCDIAGWITGACLYTNWSFEDKLAFHVTEGFKPFVLVQEDDASGYLRKDNAGMYKWKKGDTRGGVFWWDDVMKRGGIPILNYPQVRVKQGIW